MFWIEDFNILIWLYTFTSPQIYQKRFVSINSGLGGKTIVSSLAFGFCHYKAISNECDRSISNKKYWQLSAQDMTALSSFQFPEIPFLSQLNQTLGSREVGFFLICHWLMHTKSTLLLAAKNVRWLRKLSWPERYPSIIV